MGTSKHLLFVVAAMASAVTLHSGVSAQSQAAAAQPIPQIDAQVSAFFEQLKNGKSAEAYDLTLGSSPLMAGKVAERQKYLSALDTANQLYGPLQSFELIQDDRLGTMVVRRFYIAQHGRFLTRWEMHFIKLKAGWSVSYAGFEDQVRSWHK